MVILHGGPTNRKEAVDTLFLLEGENFEDAVWAIRASDGDVWADARSEHWSSDEIDRLIRRATDVPNARLKRYIGAIRWDSKRSEQQNQDLIELVKARLQDAEGAGRPDQSLISELRYIIRTIPTNIVL
jgi:hypothetical protein